MHHVGLTGNAAAGKSTVGALFREWGATVIDADAIVRDLQRAGQPVFRAIVDRFGPEVVAANGELDRDRLRQRVLGDPAAREALNAIVHPAVQRRREELVASAEAQGVPVVVHDIPLLFEVLDPADFDTVVVVDAPVPVRRARLRARGLSADAAERLMAAQMDPAAKRARADFVIENAGTRDALTRRTRAVWDAITTRRTPPPDASDPA